MKQEKSISSAQVNFGIFLVVLLVAGYIIADRIFPNQEKTDITKSITNIEQTLSPYESKEKMHKLVLTKDFDNSAPSNAPTAKIEKLIKVHGTIVEGYLYVNASADGQRLSVVDPNKFDDVYINLISLGTSKEYGGHLVENRSLETPKSDSQTEMLFSLADVPYAKTYNDPNEIVSGNWLQILNSDTSSKVVAFSSTLKQGKLIEVSIYYSCLENTDCSITLAP